MATVGLSENPYAPGEVRQPEGPARRRISSRLQQTEGSFALGFGLLGLWGLLGCWLLAKPETKRGAGMGFLARLLFVVVLIGVMALLG